MPAGSPAGLVTSIGVGVNCSGGFVGWCPGAHGRLVGLPAGGASRGPVFQACRSSFVVGYCVRRLGDGIEKAAIDMVPRRPRGPKVETNSRRDGKQQRCMFCGVSGILQCRASLLHKQHKQHQNQLILNWPVGPHFNDLKTNIYKMPVRTAGDALDPPRARPPSVRIW